ncbi:MAG TPA: ABC transporter permease [Candidatus Acidoferrum sp.]|nr:ABC transporter permease [Candidatus Acidoferrum sp.]
MPYTWKSQLRAFADRLAGLFRSSKHDDFDEEVQSHFQMLVDHFVAQGMSLQDAAAAARRQFGNTTLLRENRKELRSLVSIEDFARDFRYALRSLGRSRAFAAVAIATLALGIGASTAIFSVIDNVLLEPFPYKDAKRMVFPRIHDVSRGEEGDRQGYTSNEFLEFAAQNQVFDGLTGALEDLVLYKHGDGVDLLYGADVTPGTFEFFGMPALHGRVLQSADYEPGAPPVFVLRYKTWIERFNGDKGLLNKTFLFNGTARTLVGIMPPRFGWYDADVFIPQKPVASAATVGLPVQWFLLGRLRPGISKTQAAADLTVIANHLANISPRDYPAHFQMSLNPLGDTVVGHFESTLYTILAAVALLLLIGCANVANLMLARATSREQEFALRAALGAGSARLVRLLLVESLVLAIGGAALGLFVAWGGLKLIVAAMPQNFIPAESVIELNAPVLIFSLIVAILTAMLFGLAPALQAARRDLNHPIRESGKGLVGGRRSGRMRDTFVVIEVAVSLTLLIGAGLLMRSFVALREVRLGIQADHVFQTQLVLPDGRYKTSAQVSGFFEPLLTRVKALPGVVDAAESSSLPPDGAVDSTMEISGKARDGEWHTLLQQVSEGYFRVLAIPLQQGRTFTQAEVSAARKVAVVNEKFVSTYFRGADPVGQRVKLSVLETFGDPVRDPWFDIIGVVPDIANQGLQGMVSPEVWVPYTVTGSGAQALLVRTQQTPMSLMNEVRRAVSATDPDVPLAFPIALEERIGQRLYAGPRFAFVLMAIFGCLGLILVTIGVYSVLAYATTRKTHEIGIRMALGADRANVLRLVVKTGLRLVTAGIAIGLLASLLLGRVVQSELSRGVKPYDPTTLAVTTILLIATGALACWIPARRATRVDPMVALRYE